MDLFFPTCIQSTVPSNAVLVDKVLAEYGDVLYHDSPPRGSLQRFRIFVFGINLFVPELSRKLSDAGQALRGWEKQVPARSPRRSLAWLPKHEAPFSSKKESRPRPFLLSSRSGLFFEPRRHVPLREPT